MKSSVVEGNWTSPAKKSKDTSGKKMGIPLFIEPTELVVMVIPALRARIREIARVNP